MRPPSGILTHRLSPIYAPSAGGRHTAPDDAHSNRAAVSPLLLHIPVERLNASPNPPFHPSPAITAAQPTPRTRRSALPPSPCQQERQHQSLGGPSDPAHLPVRILCQHGRTPSFWCPIAATHPTNRASLTRPHRSPSRVGLCCTAAAGGSRPPHSRRFDHHLNQGRISSALREDIGPRYLADSAYRFTARGRALEWFQRCMGVAHAGPRRPPATRR